MTQNLVLSIICLLLAGCSGRSDRLIEKVPEFSENNSIHDWTQYTKEFPGKWSRDTIFYPGGTNSWQGKFFCGDEDKLTGLVVANTVIHSPKQKRLLYIWDFQHPQWQEVKTLDKFSIKNPLLVRSDKPFIIFEDIDKGIPYVDTKLYLYDIAKKEQSNIGYGYAVQVSPDKRKIVFCRSDGTGFENIIYWDVDTRTTRVLFSYLEGDPWEGTTMFYRWSSDSQVIYFSGKARGFGRKASTEEFVKENFFYFVPEDKFITYKDNKNDSVKWK